MTFPTAPLGSVFAVRNGATPSSSEEANWDGDIPWVGPADLGQLSGRYVERGSRSLTRRGYESCGTQIVPAGAIILSTRAPIGHTAIASQALCFNQGCRGLVPAARIDRDFAYWAVLEAKPRLQAAGQGTTFLELPRGKLRATKVSLPDLPAQKAIAAFLDRETARIDQLIEKKQRLVELLGERERAAVNRLLVGRELPSIVRKSSGCDVIGDLPESWTPMRVRSLVSHLGNGYVGPTRDILVDEDHPESVPYLQSTHIKRQQIDFHRKPYFVTQSWLEKKPKARVQEGDLLIVQTGDCGATSIVDKAFSGAGCHALVVARPIRSLIEPRLLLRYLTSQIGRAKLKAIETGALHPHLEVGFLKDLIVPVPPRDHQAALLDQIDLEIESGRRFADLAQRSIDRLKEYRSALITAAVTGQIDVATWSRRGEGDRRLDRIEAEMAG